MNKYAQAAEVIIGEQKQVIGPLAIDLAKKVVGLDFFNSGVQPSISGDPKNVLQQLVGQYSKLFGRTSIEVSKEAIKRNSIFFQPGELPDILA